VNDQTSNSAAYAEQAFYFIERRRLEDARRVLKEGLQHFPEDPDLLFHSAQVDWLADHNEAVARTHFGIDALARRLHRLLSRGPTCPFGR